MKSLHWFLCAGLVAVAAFGDGMVVRVENGPQERFQAIASVPFEGSIAADVKALSLVELGQTGERLGSVPAVLDRTGDKPELVCMLPGVTAAGAVRQFAISGEEPVAEASSDLVVEETDEEVVVRNSYMEIRHPKRGAGGLPKDVVFRLSGRHDPDLFLLDRIYRRDTKGQYLLSNDPEATARVALRSPLRVVVEARARYCRNGKPTDGNPRATYRFIYSPYSPVVEVVARMEKDDDTAWNELHFLHLTREQYHFTSFVAGDPAKVYPMNTPGEKSQHHRGSRWAVMATESNAAGVGYGPVDCWDASDEFYYYVCSHRQQWTTRTVDRHEALYFGPAIGEPAGYSRWLSGPGLSARLVTGTADVSTPPSTVPPPQGAYELSNDALRLVFGGAEEGFACLGIENRLAGNVRFVHSRDGAPGLWKLEFRTPYEPVPEGSDRKPEEILFLDNRASGNVQATVTMTDAGQLLTCTWQGLDLGDEAGVVDVMATILLAPGQGESEWRIKVDNRSKRFGLWEASYPLLSTVSPRGTADVLVPSGNWGGKLWKQCKGSLNVPYPSGACPVQFMAFNLGNAGLYFGAHDPGARTKSVRLTGEQDATFATSAEDMGVPGSDEVAPFPVVVAAYQGDWWQAARRYRQWATQQAWTRKGWIRDRQDYPQQLEDLGLWWIASGPADGVKNFMLAADERCPLPIGLHWYNWHQIPFDNSYPEYFPTKPGVPEATRELVDRGQIIMPYINGRLWDEDIPSFAEQGLAGSCKQRSGEPYTEIYGSGRRLAPMCPTTQVWQDKVAEVCHRLMTEVGVNGIYLDQIGAARPRPCFDPSHGHSLGGGRHWVDAYRTMLNPIKAEAVEKGCTLTTENTAEPYMDTIDAFLAWSPRIEQDVPVLPAVYSGYTLYFTSPQDAKDDLSAFALAQGRDFLWGCQLGWNSNWLLGDAHREKLDFMIRASQLRVAAQRFMVHGQLLDEIRPTEPVPTMTVTWNRRTPHPATLPAVQGTLWRSLDGELAAMFMNAASEPREIAWQVTPADWGVKGERWLVERYAGGETVPTEVSTGGTLIRRERLAPYEVRGLVLRTAADEDVRKAVAQARALRNDPVRGSLATDFLFGRALAERGLAMTLPALDQTIVRGEPADLRIALAAAGKGGEFIVAWPDGKRETVSLSPGQRTEAEDVLWVEEEDGVAERTVTVGLPGTDLVRDVPFRFRFVPTVSVQMSAPTGVHGGESFLLPVSVRNNSRAARSGRVIVRPPAAWALEPAGEIAVERLGPGQTQSFLLKCTTPQAAADVRSELSAVFAEEAASVDVLLRKSRPIARAFPAKNIKIDGSLADWSTPVQIALGGQAGGVKIEKEYGGAEDCSATLRLAWDAAFLYLAAEVKDNVAFQEEDGFQLWRGDCIQLAFRDGAPNRQPGYDGTEFEVGLTESPKGPLVFQWTPGGEPVDDAQLVVTRTGTTTVYEAAIPWKALGIINPRSAKRVSWSTTVNDNDGDGFRGWLEWTPGVCGGKDSSAFGWLELE
jgi:hypothetical protein